MTKVVQLEISRIAFGTRSISCRNTPTPTHAIELVGCAGLSELAGKFPTSRLPEAHWHHKPICLAPSPKRKVWLVVWQRCVGRSVGRRPGCALHRGEARQHPLETSGLPSRRCPSPTRSATACLSGRQASAPWLSPRRLAKSSARHPPGPRRRHRGPAPLEEGTRLLRKELICGAAGF